MLYEVITETVAVRIAVAPAVAVSVSGLVAVSGLALLSITLLTAGPSVV